MSFNIREIIAEARSQGWSVERTEGNHWRFVPPARQFPIVYTSGTPSDFRAVKNLVSQLRRCGLVWPSAKAA